VRGFFAIGIIQTKCEANVGTLIRSAYAFGANFVFTVGRRYKPQASSLKLKRHIPVFHFDTFAEAQKCMPGDIEYVAVELTPKSKPLHNYVHPERAVYLLGAEDKGIPEDILSLPNMCKVQIHSILCLNVATAGSIVMYDRLSKKTFRYQGD